MRVRRSKRKMFERRQQPWLPQWILPVTVAISLAGSGSVGAQEEPTGGPRLENASIEFHAVRGIRSASIEFQQEVRGIRSASIEFDLFEDGRQIEVLPEMLDFGVVGVGSASMGTLIITNVGFADLTVSDISLSGSGDFSLDDPPLPPLVLSQGQSQVLTVEFAPQAIGIVSGLLEINSDDEETPSVFVSLNGAGELKCSGPRDCDDDNGCTDDSCDPASGCVRAFNSAPCDDGNLCTTADTCSGGSCVGGPPLNCNDGLNCTVDSCDPVAGCSSLANACVDLDIKPGACPNHVNVASQGKLTVALAATARFNIALVDLDSLQLARADGVGGRLAPASIRFDDIATPQAAPPCACHMLAGDGFKDLNMKFLLPDLVEALELSGLSSGTLVELVLTGTLSNGTPLAANDCIAIRGE